MKTIEIALVNTIMNLWVPLKAGIAERLCVFFFGTTAPIWALAYLHETLRFTSVF
jgi:hypothetical protein